MSNLSKFATHVAGIPLSSSHAWTGQPYYPVPFEHIVYESDETCIYQNENGNWCYLADKKINLSLTEKQFNNIVHHICRLKSMQEDPDSELYE